MISIPTETPPIPGTPPQASISGTGGNSSSVYRFYDWMTGLHFYTANPTEINNALSQENFDGQPPLGYRNEGIAFLSSGGGDSQLLRFRNLVTNTVFYSSNPTDISNATQLGFVNEGTAFGAYSFPAPGTIPVYRFVDIARFNQTGEIVHFFTPNEAESLNVRQNLSNQWLFEGVGFYALPVTGTGSNPPVINNPSNNAFEQQVVELTNQYRIANGLSPLTLNSRLDSAADNHTQNMAQQDFFSHTDLTGAGVADRVNQTGYNGLAGENIGVGYSTPQEVLQGWINSPGHRDNILNPAYKEIGVGYFFLANDTGNERWGHYWTQVFGIPLN